MAISRGASALKRKTNERGAKAALAQQLGIPQSMISHWISGFRTPSLAYAVAMQRYLSIPCEWWIR